MADEDFPQKVYITRDPTEKFLLANQTLMEAVGGSSEPVEMAEYIFAKAFKAQAVVQLVSEGEEA
jgi:hypothetical protein